MKRKILFISHNAGRTGAPIMLLNMLRWMRTHADLHFEVLLANGGGLEAEFTQLADTRFYSPQPAIGFFSRVVHRLGMSSQEDPQKYRGELLARYQEFNPDLVYANTITNGEILEFLAPLRCPVITHVHELSYWIEQGGTENLERVINQTSRYVAASCAVKENLTSTVGIPAGQIDVVHSFTPIPKQLPTVTKIRAVRKSLSIPVDAFMVIGSGYESWRKGKDLFVQLAQQTMAAGPSTPVYFVWIGGWESSEEKARIDDQVRRCGLAGKLLFVGEVPDPSDYFSAADVFTMVSREDPFPLVCLEAAAFGKPVLCFADAGGMPEFVEGDAGFIAPYLDLDTMRQQLLSLMNDCELLRRMGEAARRKVGDDYSLDAGCQRILNVINKLLGNPAFPGRSSDV